MDKATEDRVREIVREELAQLMPKAVAEIEQRFSAMQSRHTSRRA